MSKTELFNAAAKLPPAERAAFLDNACDAKPELRREIESLLQGHDAPHSFLRDSDERTASYEDPPMEGPGTRVGPYKLLQEIGEGGMGTVFMAEQEEPIRRMVAVKIIRAGMDSKAVLARFEAERQALAMMDHPNIAKVLDAGATDSGNPYFVMELVKGVPITRFCDEQKYDLRKRLELFVPVCQAIQHAHQKGIIHRDIKPSNVLVAMYDDKPVPKVIDFGVAKAASQKLTDKTMFTAFGAVIGTLEYMSPEQAKLNQLDIDTRSDVYALGVLLYELLTGSTPLGRDRLKSAALDEILRLIREEEPPRPSTRLSTAATLPEVATTRRTQLTQLGKVIRGELDWIVMKSLEKDRTRRYDTAIGLAKDVERYLKGDSVEACPPTLGYRLRKAYRRNKAAVLVGSAFVLVLVSGLIATSYGFYRADRERERAEGAERSAVENALKMMAAADEANAQRARAEREQKRAEEEKRASEAVRAFLQDDLLRQADVTRQADPNPLAGDEFEIKPNPTVRELLDRAAIHLTTKRIEQKFPGMPFVQAEVLHAVADAYWGVAEDERSRELIDRAVVLYRTARGDKDPITLKARKSQLQLGLTLPDEKYDALMTSFIEDATQVYGPQDRLVLEVRIQQAYRPAVKKRPAEAIPALKKLRTELTELLGPTDHLTLICGGDIVLAYFEDKQFLAAVREMESLRNTVKGMAVRFDHPLMQSGGIIAADIYRAMGNIKKAIELYEEILDNWKQRGQPYNRNTWQPRHLLAWIYARNGNLAKGAELFEANVAAAPSSFNAYLSMNALREAEEKLGRDDKALIHRARQGLAASIGNRGANYKSWVTGHARIRLGQQLLRTKEYSEAETMLTTGLREMIDEYPHVRDYSRNAIPEGLQSLLDLYKATNRQDTEMNFPKDLWVNLEQRVFATSKWNMSSSLGWKIISDHPALSAKLFELSARLATKPEEKSKAYYGLFHAEQKLGKLDDARKHAQAAIDVIVTARGPEHRSYQLGMARSAFGVLLSQLKEPAAAEQHLLVGCREVADHADQIPTYDFPHRATAFNHLIRILEETNRPDEAKKWAAERQILLDKLMRKTLAGKKFTTATVTLLDQLVQGHITQEQHEDALLLYREINEKYAPVDKPVAEAMLRLAGKQATHYEEAKKPDEAAKWKALSEAK